MKNETLSINRYVVLFGLFWMIMLIITLKVRYMPRLCGRRLNLGMPQSFKKGASLSDHLNEFQEIIDQMLGMGIKFEDEIL
ncbi:hypothetical protein CR513_15892, partial [Mucuna pruriens]